MYLWVQAYKKIKKNSRPLSTFSCPSSEMCGGIEHEIILLVIQNFGHLAS